ncbi:hypothetical protein PR048_008464 [Dryococelus australis]|uniref:Nucleic-acid-binding protein from transposon X-element n=1 Tax=Dryococelus australis TaxID=614101 RepID=A0ABQ9HY38_9NEOP|nr:hypothetical protein PR048_008464 [Dryococelus australis]
MVPIIIDKTLDYKRLITLLNAEIGPQYKITFTQQGIKVLTTTTHAYNTAKDALKKQNIHFYTFTPREEKSHSTIFKGLPASIDIDIIKQELTEHHIHLKYIEQFTSKTGQVPERTIRKQGIFKVIIPDYETELLHKIDEINRTTVYWEEYQPRTAPIPQCANCQSQRMKCKQEKLEEHYHTKSCLKPATILANCVNCKGQHPANYRQCSAFIAAKNSRPKQNCNTTENQTQPMKHNIQDKQ